LQILLLSDGVIRANVFYVHIGGIRIDYVTSAVYEGLRILDWLLGKKKKKLPS